MMFWIDRELAEKVMTADEGAMVWCEWCQKRLAKDRFCSPQCSAEAVLAERPQPKIGGRKKGTPNKRTQELDRIIAVVKMRGWDRTLGEAPQGPPIQARGPASPRDAWQGILNVAWLVA